MPENGAQAAEGGSPTRQVHALLACVSIFTACWLFTASIFLNDKAYKNTIIIIFHLYTLVRRKNLPKRYFLFQTD